MKTQTHRRGLVIQKQEDKKKFKRIKEKRYSDKAIQDRLILEVNFILGNI